MRTRTSSAEHGGWPGGIRQREHGSALCVTAADALGRATREPRGGAACSLTAQARHAVELRHSVCRPHSDSLTDWRCWWRPHQPAANEAARNGPCGQSACSKLTQRSAKRSICFEAQSRSFSLSPRPLPAQPINQSMPVAVRLQQRSLYLQRYDAELLIQLHAWELCLHLHHTTIKYMRAGSTLLPPPSASHPPLVAVFLLLLSFQLFEVLPL